MAKLITVLLFFIFMLPFAQAEDGGQLLERIERAAQEKESDWAVTQKSSHETTLMIAFTYNKPAAGTEEPKVLITAEIAKSVEKAKSRFKEASRVASSIPDKGGARGKKRELNDLGEEGISYPSLMPNMVGITFRRGKVNVHIDASSEEAARRFADLIAGALTAP
jgi:hypothetical protein